MKGYKLYSVQGIAKDRADGSTNICFNTLELSEVDFAIVRKCNKQAGTLIFAPEAMKDEIKDVKGTETKKRSPSQQLRFAMQDWYSREHSNLIGFQDFYENWIIKKVIQFRGAE